MTEPLVVDASRLKAAGTTLQGLVFPAPPPPMLVPGADVVSAAIDETLPVIESPVIDGLPAVKTAVTRTGSSIVAAAGMYADADHALGEHVNGVQLLNAVHKPAAGVASGRLSGAAADKPKGVDTPSNPGQQPTSAATAAPISGITNSLGQVANPLTQVGELSQAMGPVTQNLQTIMSSVQQAAGSAGRSGAAPAQLADGAQRTEQSATDQAQLVGETNRADQTDQQPEALAEGAAPGEQALGGALPQPTSAGRPGAASSGIQL